MSTANRAHENQLAGETSPYLLQHKHNPVDWRPWGPAALEEAKRANKPILLSVGYAACHWCHVMAHESFEDEDTARVMNELFVNIKVDREERPDIDQIYMSALHHLGEQGGWPLTMFLTPAGEPVWGGTYFPKISRYGRPAFVDVLREIARMFRQEPGKIEQNRAALMSRLAETARAGQKIVVGARELDGFALQIAGLIDTRHGGMRGAPKFPQAALFEFLWRAGMRESASSWPGERSPERPRGSTRPSISSQKEDGSPGHAASRRPGDDEEKNSAAPQHSDPHPNPPPQAGEGGEGAGLASFEGGLRPPPQDDGAALGERFFALVELTLERISEGGIYDHLGGGFSRYSVDERWLVPHFEKMLYDNAQLLELLALAYARSGNLLFAARARETIGWLQREMITGEGAFAASLDADSEGEEGKFYVWSHDEIISALGPADGEFFARHYDVSAGGNFEGHNILNRLARVPRSGEDETRLAALRQKLLAVRGKRVRPGLDDKVLADWNGLMIAALVNAGAMLGEPAWIALARRAFDFIARAMTRGDRLGHSWRAGKLLFPGLASDCAAMIRAALALHEATGERAYLGQALAWQGAFDRHYANEATGGYYLTADDAEGLVLRPAGTSDDATPNPNAVAAQNLVRLALLTGDAAYRAKADRLIEGVLAGTDNHLAHIALLNAIDMRIGAAEIVVTGQGAQADALTAAALKIPFLNRIVLRAASADALPAAHPAQQKIKAATEAAAFICVGERCSLPVTRAEQIAGAVASMRAS